ncbi:MAG: hypothetical protein ACTSWE_00430 [Promethearchaeota archaeon]
MEDIPIKLTKQAFHQMIRHALRFGSPALEKRYNVVGFCLGNHEKNGKKIVIKESVPFDHVELMAEEIPAFEENLLLRINRQYESEGQSILGWYHTSLQEQIKFNERDLPNHQLIQNERNPNGFCIIFNPLLFNEDKKIELKAFRMDQLNFKDSFQYHKVELEIELPDSLEYFTWIKELIELREFNDTRFIKELREIEQIPETQLQEIPKAVLLEGEKGGVEAVKPFLSNGMRLAFNAFLNSIITPLELNFNPWLKRIEEGAIKGTEDLKEATESIKNRISRGMKKIERWISEQFTQELDEFISKLIEKKDEHETMVNQWEKAMEKTKEEIIDTTEKDLNTNYSQVIETLKDLDSRLYNTSDISRSISREIMEKYDEFRGKLNQMKEEMEKTFPKIQQDVITSMGHYHQEIDDKTKLLNEKFNALRNQVNTFQSLLNSLTDLVNQMEKS